ncbi:hypothetical protein H0A66_13625 [Alcaligenaceae bacterium]|nr:hypothetical protein [Alcaligenaceae bacterium]
MPANTLLHDIDTLKRMLVSRDETIAKLVAEIARLKCWQYGCSCEHIADHPINQFDELLPWRLDLQNENLLKAA